MSPSIAQTRRTHDSRATLRAEARPADVQAIRQIIASSDFFSEAELGVALELIEERLALLEKSDYQFVFADVSGETIGYANFGPVSCTLHSYDLYWIAVREDHRAGGIGRRLLQEVERQIAKQGGRRIYVETSSREQYEPTRRFYERCGYRVDAVQDDFYAPGDGKVTLVKVVA